MPTVTFSRLGNYGRLGNQLFQVAVCLGYAAKHGGNVTINQWYCSFTQRNISLFFKNRRPNGPLPEPVTRYREPHYHYTEIPYTENTLDLFGSFQCERYFAHCADQVRYYFEPATALKEKLVKNYAPPFGRSMCLARSILLRAAMFVASRYCIIFLRKLNA